ncbi:hypothetical protein KQI77_07605 [Clostridium sp. MSJ-8]|uniref:hypothetical protein n=1 Tax=Clostridium sp. MSJ-8 TaxID=2841510 RepID=UPI001C0EFFBD|nr:hypothetical protein [Clostridium sp. MSJ-8]MBU5488030.1 hypothetical protein [Clostridium sp. MSJ-8]
MNNRGKKILSLLIVLVIVLNLLPGDFRVKASETESYTHKIECDDNCEVVDTEGNPIEEVNVPTEDKTYQLIIKPKDKDYTISSVHLTDEEETEASDINISDTDVSYVCTVDNIEDTDVIISCKKIEEVSASDMDQYIQVTGMDDTAVVNNEDNSIWYAPEGRVLITPLNDVKRIGVYSETDSKYELDSQYILSGGQSIDKIYFEDSHGKLRVCKVSIQPIGDFTVDATNTQLLDEVTVKEHASVNNDNLKFTDVVGLDYIRYSTSVDDYNNSTYDKEASDIILVNDEEFSFELGEGTYYIWAYNKLGQKSSNYKKVTVNIDTEAPKIKSLKTSAFNNKPQGNWKDATNVYEDNDSWTMWLNSTMLNSNMAIGMEFDEEVEEIAYSLAKGQGYSDLDGEDYKKYDSLYWVPFRHASLKKLQKTYYIEVKDKLGNTDIRTISLKKDIESPKITDSNIGDIINKGWTNEYPVITFKVNDPTSEDSLASGVQSVKWNTTNDIANANVITADLNEQYNIETDQIDGSANGLNTTVYIWVTDNANNTIVEEVPIQVDPIAPVITNIELVDRNSSLFIPYDIVNSNKFWYKTENVQLKVHVKKNALETTKVELRYKWDQSSEESIEMNWDTKNSEYICMVDLNYAQLKNNKNNSLQAYDTVGNVSNVISYSLEEDSNPPQIDNNIDVNDSSSIKYLKEDQDVVLTVSDVQSGIYTATCTINDEENSTDIASTGKIVFKSKDYKDSQTMEANIQAVDKALNKSSRVYKWAWDSEGPSIDIKSSIENMLVEDEDNKYVLIGKDTKLQIDVSDDVSGVKSVEVTRNGETKTYTDSLIELDFEDDAEEDIYIKAEDNVGYISEKTIHVKCIREEKAFTKFKIKYDGSEINNDTIINGSLPLDVTVTNEKGSSSIINASWECLMGDNKLGNGNTGNASSGTNELKFNIQNKDYCGSDFSCGEVTINVYISYQGGYLYKYPIKLKIDKVAPSIESNNKSRYKTNSNVEFKVRDAIKKDGEYITECQSGVKEVRYSFDSEAYKKDTLASNQENVYKAIQSSDSDKYFISILDKNEQDINYYVWAYDNLGNKSEQISKTIEIDNTAPKIKSANIYLDGNIINDNWSNDSVEVVLDIENKDITGKDLEDLSVYYIDPITQSANIINKKNNHYTFTVNKEEGKVLNNEYKIYAVDEAGNKSEQYTKIIKIDNKSPEINIKDKDKYNKVWKQTDYDILLNVSDDASGVKKVTWSADKDGKDQKEITNKIDDLYSINTSELVDNDFFGIDGVYYFFVYDNAGNVSRETLQVQIDKTNPKLESVNIEGNGRYENDYIFSNIMPQLIMQVVDENISSGIEEVNVYMNDVNVPLKADKTARGYILMLNSAIPSQGSLWIDVVDKSGRRFYDSVDYSKDKNTIKYMLEKSKPNINIGLEKSVVINNNIYFKTNKINISATDNNIDSTLQSGIKSMKYSVWFNTNKLYEEEKTNDKPLQDIETSFNLLNDELNKYRSNKGYDNVDVTFSKVEDYATNTIENKTYSYRYDDYAPHMVEASIINGSSRDKIEATKEVAYTDKYSYNSDISIKFIATDDNGCGVEKFEYCLKDSTGKEVFKGISEADNNNSFTITDEFKNDFKGSIYVKVIDKLGNISDEYCYGGIIVEHSAESNTIGTISLSGDSRKIILDNRAVYNSNVNMQFKFSNSFAGINKIEYRVISAKDNKALYVGSNNYSGSEEELLYEYNMTYEGKLDIYIKVTDRCGNTKEFTEKIIIDKTNPKVDKNSIDTTRYYKKGDVISVKASDVDGTNKSDNQTGVSFLRYGYNEEDYNNDNYSSDRNTIKEDENGVYNISVESDKSETKMYYIWAYDNAGNKSEACIVPIDIDNTKPIINNIDKGYVGEWSNKQVELSVFIDEQGGSKLSKVEYSEDKDDYYNDSEEANKATCIKDDNIYQYNIIIDDTRDYIKTIYVWSYDNAGNKSECSEIEIKHDETLPTVDSVEVIPTRDWVNYARTIKIKVSDNSSRDGVNSGVKDIICTDDIAGETYSFDNNITKVQDGIYEVVVPEKDGRVQSFDGQYYIWVIDNAGNKSKYSETTVKTDVDKPVISDIRVIPTDRNLEKNYIRFLNFGTFSKNSMDVVVSVEDGDISSGINEVYLVGDEGVINRNSIIEAYVTTATFTLDKGTYNNLKAYAVDNADNQSEEVYIYEKDTNVKGKLGNNYMIEDTEPTIEVIAKQEECIDSHSRSWVKGTEKYNIEIQDDESGINKLTIKVNDKEKTYDYVKESSTKIMKDAIELALEEYEDPKDNIYNVTLTLEDNAGNITTKEMKFYRDVFAPNIVDIKVEPSNDNYLNNSGFEYGFYANNNRTIKVYADDGDFSCGLKSITYYLVDYTNMQAGVTSIRKTIQLVNKQATFNIPTDFKGKVCVVATDNLGNETEVYRESKGIILESNSRHQKTSKISFNKEGTSKRDIDGRELYNKDINVTFSVEDNYSGIKEIRWSVESPYDANNNKSDVINVNNGVISDKSSSCVKKKTDKNIVNEIQKTIRVSNNSNNIKVKVQLIDNAGNTTTKEINFSIDKVNPTIEVSYDNNNYNSEDGTNYYNANRIATITVKERNFDSKNVEAIIENTHGSVPSIGQWNLIADNSNPDNNRYVATLAYSEDGDYTFDIGCKDMAGNVSNDYAADRFTIDKTNPTVQVSYNNNNGANGNYYNQDRVATITINEHNFNPNSVVINGNGVEQGANVAYPSISNWSTSGDTHTATITYSQDGLYTLDVDYKDKAGNAAQDIPQDSFYIDKTKPELKISGIENGSSNNDVVMPRITYTDNNFDANNVSITLTGSLKGNVEVKGAYSDIPNGQSFIFADFDKLQEIDDIYTLNAKVIDKAGNESDDNIMFTVNRFGSVYLFDAGLQTMIGKYMNSNEDIKLTEMNADDIDLSKVKVKLSKNGITNDLTRGKDFTVEKSGGNGQWSKLDYTVKSSAFEEDGKYILTFISVDNAGNTNENIDETKGAEIWFGVDKTAPVVVPIGIESGKTYPVDHKEATLSVSDNLVLNDVKVYLNNKLVKCNVNGDNYSFDVSAKNSSQSIKVEATDEAGNKVVQEVKNFYVTTNLFVRFYTNKPLFISTIAGAVLIVTGITIASFYRRKKKTVENK